jgi:hypothetical protein
LEVRSERILRYRRRERERGGKKGERTAGRGRMGRGKGSKRRDVVEGGGGRNGIMGG